MSTHSRSPIVDQPNQTVEEIALQSQILFGKLTQQINVKINQGTDYNKVMDFIFESLDFIIPYDRIGIAIADSANESIELKWARSKLLVQHLKTNYSALLKDSSLLKILETGEPRIINNLIEYADQHPKSQSTKLAIRDGLRSSLTCPLKANDKPIGIVFFSSHKVNTYKSDHIEVFQNIASELAVIVEHARLKDFFKNGESKEQILRMTLHDLRTPLSVIKGYLDLSTSQHWPYPIDTNVRNIFETLQRNTQHMLLLLNELSDISQFQNDSIKLNIDSINLKDFCKEITNNVEILSQQKEITFIPKIESLPPTCLFDEEKIRRALENLFTNAIKFSDRGSSITFRAFSTSSKITFTVSDQGQGIALDEQALLFKEFGKTSTRPTEKENSTGLGLAIAKRIVELHGGEISVISAPGAGSTFSFWLPFVTNSVQPIG